ncbi:hypothetical protein TRICI_004100 [Trichomonascus ciferrii]|uniref:DUF4048 domain-containing protein n=1 Tax=Trichomonascus ciferrii TaxID=44093 RepID=A0A642V1W9_9ASCO|nr:hypothetical protein TRICI_004100 [Trichomonascus ciferrii]
MAPHSKSVSWHSSPPSQQQHHHHHHHQHNTTKHPDNKQHCEHGHNLPTTTTTTPDTITPTSNTGTSPAKRSSKLHRRRGPSLSISHTEPGQVLNFVSPTKQRPARRLRKKLHDRATKCRSIDSYSFKFPPSHKHTTSMTESSVFSSSDTDVDRDLSGLSPRSSTGDCSSISSPYILNSQPNLQEVFITLANKERRVLEAREQLSNAERELDEFKTKWSSILEIPYPKSAKSPPISPFDLNASDEVLDLAIHSPPPPHSPPHNTSIRRSSAGLGINLFAHAQPQTSSSEQDAMYEQVCQRAAELDSLNYLPLDDDCLPLDDSASSTTASSEAPSTSGILSTFFSKVKSTMEGMISRHSIKSWLSTLNPFDSMSSSKPEPKPTISPDHDNSSTAHTTTIDNSSGAILFPRLTYVNKYIDTVC